MSFIAAGTALLELSRRYGVGATPAAARSSLGRLRTEQDYGVLQPNTPQGLVHSFTVFARGPSDRIWLARLALSLSKLHHLIQTRVEQSIPRSTAAHFYKQHRNDFYIPERRDVADIQSFTLANALKARTELQHGISPALVVQRHNEEEHVGGVLKNLLRGKLRHTYEQDFFRAPTYKIVGPIKVEIYFLFEVLRIRAAETRSFQSALAEVTRRIAQGPVGRRLSRAEELRIAAGSTKLISCLNEGAGASLCGH